MKKKQSEPILEAARYLGADKLLVIPRFLQEQDSREVQEKANPKYGGLCQCFGGAGRQSSAAIVMEEYDSFDSPSPLLQESAGF